MEKIKILIGDDEFDINYSFLNYLAIRFPAIKNYHPLDKRMLKMGIPSIKAALAGTDILEREDKDELWQEGDINIRRELALNEGFVSDLTDEQVRDIIEEDDQGVLNAIAENADYIYPDQHYARKQGTRLGIPMADKLFEHLLNSPSADIRHKIMYKNCIRDKFKPSLEDQIKSCEYPWRVEVDNADKEIVHSLKSADFNYLTQFARNIQDVKNMETRNAIGDFLIQPPDPFIRFELAQNRNAPGEILKGY